MNVALPSWVNLVEPPDGVGDEDLMRYVLRLAQRNVVERTGGPFAAVIVDGAGSVVGVGVNLVTSVGCSVLHAEIVSIMMASESLGTWSLADHGHLTMVITAEPCAMCLGAIPWAGVRRVVTCVRDEDIRAIGFDEGNKPEGWIEHYHARGIAVRRDVLREDGLSVLEAYVASGAPIYNGGRT
jgi:tRNA(Arg) A34 adenosine deaminase TadA